jgi:hypothetical protein
MKQTETFLLFVFFCLFVCCFSLFFSYGLGTFEHFFFHLKGEYFPNHCSFEEPVQDSSYQQVTNKASPGDQTY